MKIIPYKVGEKVITDRYTPEYNGKILTIREVVNVNDRYFYYFDESNHHTHNFEHTCVAKSEKMSNKQFDKWRERVRKDLPNLANRVFSLRGVGYTGCGFHWSLEKDLGYVIRGISNFDSYPDNMEQILIKIVTESLYKELNRIESKL